MVQKFSFAFHSIDPLNAFYEDKQPFYDAAFIYYDHNTENNRKYHKHREHERNDNIVLKLRKSRARTIAKVLKYGAIKKL